MGTIRHTCISSVAAAAFAIAAAIGAAGSANAAGLFDPASSTELRAASPSASTQGALRQRLVRLNADELARIVPAGADNAADRLQRAQGLADAVTIDLFPGVSVTASRTTVEAPDEGGYVWTGKSAGAKTAFVTLVINDGEVLGHIQTGGRLYTIEPVSGALHRVIEINQDKIRDDIHMRPPADFLKKRSEAATPSAEPRARTTINVLVANTINARNEVGTATQMQARINMAIALTNTAFLNSGVLIRYTRVGGKQEVNYNEAQYGGNTDGLAYQKVLCDLTNPPFSCGGTHPNSFTAVRTARETFHADLVVLMRKQGAACGIAWVPDLGGTITPGDQGLGFSVVTSTVGGVYNCIEGNTLAHETGHNQGMNHDRIQHQLDYNVSNPPKSQYNFGYVSQANLFFTIMAYRSSCNGGSGCTRIPFYSTPLKKYNNKPVGIPAGTTNAADAARRLNLNRSTISAYR